ncbi:hypothetical protein SESBI_42723 [Sesbania bispinosa]|nr:hypothetical protein SESBI_42723 [Sesbania bispinosa]
MGRHALLALLLLSLIVFDGSDASFVKSLRNLIALNQKDNETKTKDPPPPTETKSDPNPVGEGKKSKENPPSTNNNATSPVPQPQPSTKVDNGNGNKKVTKNTPPPASAPPPPASAPPPVPKKADEGGKVQEEQKGENEGINFSHSPTSDNCDGLNTCTDEGDMLACISKIGIQLCF